MLSANHSIALSAFYGQRRKWSTEAADNEANTGHVAAVQRGTEVKDPSSYDKLQPQYDCICSNQSWSEDGRRRLLVATAGTEDSMKCGEWRAKAILEQIWRSRSGYQPTLEVHWVSDSSISACELP